MDKRKITSSIPSFEELKQLRLSEMDAAYKKHLKALKTIVQSGRLSFRKGKRP